MRSTQQTTPPTMKRSSHIGLTALLVFSGLAFVGCQADRAIVAPAEPTWSYRDGQDQLSNNSAWEQMIPASALLGIDESKVASVEESTE